MARVEVRVDDEVVYSGDGGPKRTMEPEEMRRAVERFNTTIREHPGYKMAARMAEALRGDLIDSEVDTSGLPEIEVTLSIDGIAVHAIGDICESTNFADVVGMVEHVTDLMGEWGDDGPMVSAAIAEAFKGWQGEPEPEPVESRVFCIHGQPLVGHCYYCESKAEDVGMTIDTRFVIAGAACEEVDEVSVVSVPVSLVGAIMDYLLSPMIPTGSVDVVEMLRAILRGYAVDLAELTESRRDAHDAIIEDAMGTYNLYSRGWEALRLIQVIATNEAAMNVLDTAYSGDGSITGGSLGTRIRRLIQQGTGKKPSPWGKLPFLEDEGRVHQIQCSYEACPWVWELRRPEDRNEEEYQTGFEVWLSHAVNDHGVDPELVPDRDQRQNLIELVKSGFRGA